MDHFRNIELFVTVARSGGFRVAAKILNLPNSTVSRRIAEMERDLGLRLFNRTTRRVELTESGRMYFNRCEALVEEAQAAHAELTHQAQNPSGLIRASLPVDFAADRITALIADFLRLYPQVQFELDLTPRQSDLIADPVDFVIRIGRSAGSGLIQRKLTEVPIGLFASPDYFARCAAPKRPQDLGTHKVLSILGRPLHFTPIGGGPMVEFRPTAPVLMNNVSWLKRFALAGLGIAALSPNMLRTELATGKLVAVLTDWQLPSVEVFVLTESRLLPARVRLFLDYLIENINMHDPAPSIGQS